MTTVPSFRDWQLTGISLLAYGMVALAIGIPSQFLQWTTPVDHWPQVLVKTLFVPAIFEETVFRGLLLPHPQESPKRPYLWGSINLFVFVIYHPINGLIFYEPGYYVFRNPYFLILATLLGLTCILLYQRTGSIWPPVVIHWIVVMVWICLLGGMAQLQL
ncbi:MAG: CPBP family glutamic-type intramembrane protease [Cyanobacteria bacterium P01_F01_bin.116]